MKMGIAVTFHGSPHIRPIGQELGKEYVKTLYKYCEFPFELFIIDNQSEPPFNYYDFPIHENRDNLHYTYIRNQYENGITGAWNMGIKQAIDAGCELISITNDDMIYNTSVNDYFNVVMNHPDKDNAVFAPITDGTHKQNIQYGSHPQTIIQDTRGIPGGELLVGFFYTFTRQLYDKYKYENGDLFGMKHKYDGGDGKWGGQEGEVRRWWEDGTKLYCVRHGYFPHNKMYTYRAAKKIDEAE